MLQPGFDPGTRGAAWILVVTGVFLLALTAAGLMAWYFWATGGEVRESRYTDYAEARSSVAEGWLPQELPVSATSIHEWHDLDTNSRLGSFRFDPEDWLLMERALEPGVPSEIRIDRDPSFAAPVPYDPAAGQLEDLGFEFFQGGDVWFAVNSREGMAYFWGPAF